ncbi:MAG: alpha/beta hydrolase [Candidatus Micrarchaeota archaeon]|nr:alpha/beta hydrolase [Candidatus Micrarchaeota archaeon]
MIGNIKYCSFDSHNYSLDLYMPVSQLQEQRPLIIYVHGGAFTSGDKNNSVGNQIFPYLVSNGFVVASIDYGLLQNDTIVQEIEETKCSIRFLRVNARLYGIDPQQIGIWGASAGGYLATITGTTNSISSFNQGQYLNYSSNVSAVCDWFGVTVIARYIGVDAHSSLQEQETAKQLQPGYYASKNDPPFIIFHGTNDSVVPLNDSLQLYDELTSNDVNVELVLVKNSGHDFMQVGNKSISPSFTNITDETISFFKKNLQ